jgi:hypothetical protein
MNENMPLYRSHILLYFGDKEASCPAQDHPITVEVEYSFRFVEKH